MHEMISAQAIKELGEELRTILKNEQCKHIIKHMFPGARYDHSGVNKRGGVNCLAGPML